MPDYSEMYRMLFRSQTAAIELQEQAVEILKKAQQETEELYISASNAVVRILPDKKNKGESESE